MNNILTKTLHPSRLPRTLIGLGSRPYVRSTLSEWTRNQCALSTNVAVPCQRMFSSNTSDSGSSFSMNPIDWWRNSQERKDKEKFEKRVTILANMESFKLIDMADELEESITGLRAKFAAMTGAKEIEGAKNMLKQVKALMEIVGTDATDETLQTMSQINKFKAANAADASIEDLNILIHQFGSMSIMQRVLRKRQLEGKRLPMSADRAQMIVQREAPLVMSKAEKARFQKRMSASQQKRR